MVGAGRSAVGSDERPLAGPFQRQLRSPIGSKAREKTTTLGLRPQSGQAPSTSGTRDPDVRDRIRLAQFENVDERTPYELAYQEAVRALSQQQSVLDNFRTRAGARRLLSMASTPQPVPRPEPQRPSPMKPEGRDAPLAGGAR